MKRASYRHAIELIALNDNAGSDNAKDVDEVFGYFSVGLVADIFGVDQRKVATDVVRARQEEWP